MKKIAIALMLVLGVMASKAQQTVGSADDLARFMKTTTYVVLENNPMLQYNHVIKETVEKHWTLTPVEFVTFSTKEFEKVRLDSTKSFLIVNTVFYDRDKTKAKYKFLCVELGGDYKYVRQMPDIASMPIAYEDVEEDTYAYKLGMMCLFLQNHIQLTLANPKLTSKNVLKHYYKTMTGDVKNKTLYLTKNDLAKGFGMKEIKAVYPYDVKLVTREEVEAAIDTKDENVVFVHKVGPEGSKRKARCYKTIVGTDAQLYYFGWHMISDKAPEGLTKKDWKKLAKAKVSEK